MAVCSDAFTVLQSPNIVRGNAALRAGGLRGQGREGSKSGKVVVETTVNVVVFQSGI